MEFEKLVLFKYCSTFFNSFCSFFCCCCKISNFSFKSQLVHKTLALGIAVEKIKERALFIKKLIISLFATAKAPCDAKAFPNVAVIISISSKLFSKYPHKFLPKTPKAWASSTIRTQLYFFFNSISFSTEATSPSMLNIDSEIMKAFLYLFLYFCKRLSR